MTTLEWKRATRDETSLCHRRTWHSRCGGYRVEEHRPKLTTIFCTTYYAIAGLKILGRHRVRSAAEKDCERHAKSQQMECA